MGMALSNLDRNVRWGLEEFLEIDSLNRYRENKDWVLLEYRRRAAKKDAADLEKYLTQLGYDVLPLTVHPQDDDTTMMQKCDELSRYITNTKCQFIIIKNMKDKRTSLLVPCFEQSSSPFVMYFNPLKPSDMDEVICMSFRHFGNLNA